MVAKKGRLAALLMTVLAGFGSLGTASAQTEYVLTAESPADCAAGQEVPVTGNLSLAIADAGSVGAPLAEISASVDGGDAVVVQSDLEGNYALSIEIPSGVETGGDDVIIDVAAKDLLGSAVAATTVAIDAYCSLTVGTSSATEDSWIDVQDAADFPDSLIDAILGVDEVLKVDAEDMTDGSGVITAPGINCSGPNTDCTAEFLGGSEVTLTATADAGSVFAGWDTFKYVVTDTDEHGNGVVTEPAEEVLSVCAGQGAACTFTIVEDTMTQVDVSDDPQPVTAFFEPAVQDLSVAISEGSGSIDSDLGGISCPGTCSATLSYGDEVTLTATPADGFEVVGWTGACAGSATDQCVLVADDDKEAGVIFQPVA